MRDDYSIYVVIPVLNESQTIKKVLDAIPRWVDETVVADNGSTDGSPIIAKEAGASVVFETERGYGAACLKAMAYIDSRNVDANRTVVVFLDGDFSDDPDQMDELVDPIVMGEFDFVVGSRVTDYSNLGALTTPQRFGNWLACVLMQVLYDARYADLGPFRAVRWQRLMDMNMDDRNFGWTVQMQIRAAKLKLRTLEVPVRYRHRAGGKSKVSGTISGVWGAGTTILRVIFNEYLKNSEPGGIVRKTAACLLR